VKRDRLHSSSRSRKRRLNRLGQVETQQPAGRHKYFTEDEAERVDNLDATPAVWMLDQVAAATESHRPLDPVLSEIERFFPQLAETDLLEFIQLQGRTETSERFYANEVLSR